MPHGEGPVRVLFVDDDPERAEMAATFMERAERSLVVAPETDPTQVLGRLDAGAFDCIISAYAMAGVDGLDVLAVVRDNHPDLPFVLFTANGSEDVASEAISVGVTEYVPKEAGTDHYRKLATRISDMAEEGEFSDVERRRASPG